uniref:Core domain-containing protein n=1 Tax=Leptocylindrus danicus TaxID=163516 RepID=A0A7S2PCF3_9STRA
MKMKATLTLTATATALLSVLIGSITTQYTSAFTPTFTNRRGIYKHTNFQKPQPAPSLNSEVSTSADESSATKFVTTPLDDAVIRIKLTAMDRLMELKAKQSDPSATLVLRMGVRNGGCSGLSYVMDFSSESEIEEEDQVDEYPDQGIKCVVDAKSMLYLYGLELDFSDELIGGGFKFFNPNAEDSCGCGSSFGV